MLSTRDVQLITAHQSHVLLKQDVMRCSVTASYTDCHILHQCSPILKEFLLVFFLHATDKILKQISNASQQIHFYHQTKARPLTHPSNMQDTEDPFQLRLP